MQKEQRMLKTKIIAGLLIACIVVGFFTTISADEAVEVEITEAVLSGGIVDVEFTLSNNMSDREFEPYIAIYDDLDQILDIKIADKQKISQGESGSFFVQYEVEAEKIVAYGKIFVWDIKTKIPYIDAVQFEITELSDGPMVRITKVYLDEYSVGNGNFAITGYIENAEENSEATIVISDNAEIIDGNIIYIWQVSAGANGAFIFKGEYDAVYGGKTAYINIGATGCERRTRKRIELPFAFNGSIETVANNSAVYGADVYRIENNADLNAANVRDSILTGGNCLYYKIGGNFYDLLDEDARDSGYFVPENAMDIEIMKNRKYRYYYNGRHRLNFENAA